jgi:hypothetical protein
MFEFFKEGKSVNLINNRHIGFHDGSNQGTLTIRRIVHQKGVPAGGRRE